MIIERHTTFTIFNWLTNRISNDIPSPKKAVRGQSIALLSEIVQCFTQYSSLNQYLVVCTKLTLGKVSSNSHCLPNFFIRTDIAHFMKLVLVVRLPLKSISRRVREVILHSIGSI